MIESKMREVLESNMDSETKSRRLETHIANINNSIWKLQDERMELFKLISLRERQCKFYMALTAYLNDLGVYKYCNVTMPIHLTGNYNEDNFTIEVTIDGKTYFEDARLLYIKDVSPIDGTVRR